MRKGPFVKGFFLRICPPARKFLPLANNRPKQPQLFSKICLRGIADVRQQYYRQVSATLPTYVSNAKEC